MHVSPGLRDVGLCVTLYCEAIFQVELSDLCKGLLQNAMTCLTQLHLYQLGTTNMLTV